MAILSDSHCIPTFGSYDKLTEKKDRKSSELSLRVWDSLFRVQLGETCLTGVLAAG